MQLRADQLAAHLQRGLKPLYLVHGDEPLLVQEACDAIRAAARAAGHAERQVFTVSGAHFDWSAVLGAAQSLSLFAERRLIDLRIPSGKPGKEGSEALQRHVEHLSADLLTLVSCPRLDFQQVKSAWFTALDAAGVVLRVDAVERHALPAWIAQRLARQGQHVADGEAGQRTLAFFADRVEGHLLAAHQEIEKLALLYPPGELSFEAVEAAVLDVARYELHQLGEAVLAGQVARSLRLLDALRAEGEPVVRAHWLLAEDLRALKRARDALDAGRPLPMALREARVWGVREKLFERALPRIDGTALDPLLRAAADVDGIAKGLRVPGWPDEPWDALRRLVLLMLEALAPARGARRLALAG